MWPGLFDNYDSKQVTQNDKRKNAYVLTAGQCAAVEAAGIRPARGVGINLPVLLDPEIKFVDASFYYSERSESAGRKPEPRLGREFIRSWLNEGDQVLIGNIGAALFALKLPENLVSSDDVVKELARKGFVEAIMEKAERAAGSPARRTVARVEFVRDPFVVQGALLRAGGKCEVPNCSHPLFYRDNGEKYLEVHHIIPLAEGGDDSLANVAALCPSCHREAHHGQDRGQLRAILISRITARS